MKISNDILFLRSKPYITMNQTLIQDLEAWDGKHRDYLLKLYEKNITQANFFENLVEIYQQRTDLQVVSSWLIKHQYDLKKTISQELIDQVLEICNEVEHWEARLHILQLLPHWEIKEDLLLTVDDFVRKCLEDNNKFIRAWAFEGMFAVARYIPEYIPELKMLCQHALENESAAIKSKVRHIVKKIDKLK